MKKAKTRQEILNHDLISYHPKKWSINLPFKNYSLRVEDIIPALSGAIGKISLVAAFAVAWAAGFAINDLSFVTENVRLDMFVGSIFTLLFCAILNPFAGPPGTLAPLIPLIPLMVTSGVHPLPLSILIGIIGLLLSGFKYFSKIVELNGPGTKGGIILLFGLMGIISSLDSLKKFTTEQESPILLMVLILAGLAIYIILNRFNARWLIIPICAAVALLISNLFGILPSMDTKIALPIINPSTWWNEKWGIGFGLTAGNFVKALPFALLAIVMWPIDALAIKTIQETNYPKEAKKAIFDMNATYLIVSLRNMVAVFLGGAQIAAVWRSFMIPLGMVKRPIGGSALILGILGILFSILGFPIDIAVFPPLLWMVLIFGVYIPLIEVGFSTIKSASSVKIATTCIIAGFAFNPVIGWIISVFIENFNIIKDEEVERNLSKKDLIITAILIAVTLITFISSYML